MARIDPKSKRANDAIRLKYEGESYDVISKAVKTPVETVRSWFKPSGVLREQYEEYSSEQNTFKKKEAQETISKNITTAASMLVALMGSADDNVKFRAAKELLDRELGSPKETVEHRGLFGTDLSYEQILRKAREKPPPDG
jgi:esterase/lipase